MIINPEYFPDVTNCPDEPLYINGVALPYKYQIETSGDLTVRAKAEKRAYSHGATNSGDGYIDSKKIKITITVEANSYDDFLEKSNALCELFYQKDYKLSVGGITYWNVTSLEKTTCKYLGAFQFKKGDWTFSLLLCDPFRYADAETTVTQTYAEAASEAEISIYNGGSVETPLTFIFAPVATMNNIIVTQPATGKSMRVADTLLTTPATLTVNTKEGTVRRDTYNAINAFSGQFLTALPGENKYLVTCAQGTVTVKLTDRWLV